MENMNRVHEGLRDAMTRNENIVLLFGKGGGGAENPGAIEAGRRILDFACGPRELLGMAAGMGVYGLHPVVHLNQDDLHTGAYQQLLNSVSQFRFRSGGQYSVPLVVLVRYKDALRTDWMVANVPGLHVYAPSCEADFSNTIERLTVDKDPSLVFVPSEWVPMSDDIRVRWEEPSALGDAKVLREGSDITLVAYGRATGLALEAAAEVANSGKSPEVIDLRRIAPIDRDAILASVRKTGRLVIISDAPGACGVGAEVAAFISEAAIDSLLGPVRRVAAFDVPDAGALSAITRPDMPRVMAAVRSVLEF